MSSQLLNLIENFLSSELSVGLSLEALAACDDVNPEQLKLLRSHIEEWDFGLHERLALPIDVDSAAPADEGRPFSAMFTHPYNGLRPIQIDHIKRQLLFFPKVAIVRPDLPYSHELRDSRSLLKIFLQSLLDLKELLRDGTVQLIPLSGFYSNEIEGTAGFIRKACQNDAGIFDWLRTKSDLIADFSANAKFRDPYFDAGIRIASALTYGHQLAATHPFVGELYAQLIHGGAPPDRETIAIGTNLEKISLPGLSGLDWKDIIAIRQDQPSFQKWRADLQEVIAGVDPALSPAQFVSRFNAIARARLTRSALDLERELKRSAMLTRIRKGVVTFAIGAVASAATIATFGPPADSNVWTAVSKAVETGGISAALQFLWTSKRSSGEKALRSHYSVFAPK